MDNSPIVQTALTVGDVLPSNMRAQYDNAVLGTSMKIAMDITIYGKPKPEDMTEATYTSIQDIYKSYQARTDKNTDSSYWNKSQRENLAFWNKSGQGRSFWRRDNGTSYWNKSDGNSYWNKSSSAADSTSGGSYWNKKG